MADNDDTGAAAGQSAGDVGGDSQQSQQGGDQGQGQQAGENLIKLTPGQLAEKMKSAAHQKEEELKAKGLILTPEEVAEKQRMAREEEDRKRAELHQAGDYKQLLENQQREFERVKSELDRRTEEQERKIQDMTLDRVLTDGLTDKDTPKLRDDVSMARIKQLILLDGGLTVKSDGSVVVVNPDGSEKYNAQAQPMAVREHVTEWLRSNAWAIAPTGRPGPGGHAGLSQGDIKLPPNAASDPRVFESLSQEQKNQVLAEVGLTPRGAPKQLIGRKPETSNSNQ